MNTWTSNALLFCLTTLLLVGCDEADQIAFNSNFATSQTPSGIVSRSEKTTQIAISGGDVVVTAPDGYCIDRRSARRNPKASFVMIARCDTLGVDGFYRVFDLALMTVTTAPLAPEHSAPGADDLAKALAPAQVLDQSSKNGVSLVRLGNGSHQLEDVSQIHWRGAFALNGQLVGLGLYAPDTSPAIRRGGRQLLYELAQRTIQASAKPATTVKSKNN